MHPPHSVVAPYSQVVLGNGGHHHLRIALEVVKKGSLQYEVDSGAGMLHPH